MFGSIVGGLFSVFGASQSYKAQKRAFGEINKNIERLIATSEEGVDIAQANLDYWTNQQAIWGSMFGDLEQNLVSYFNTLTPESLAAEGREQIQTEITNKRERLLNYLSDRGLSSSGQAVQALTSFGTAEAVALANNAYRANRQAITDTANFFRSVAEPRRARNEAGIQTGQSQLLQANTNLASAFQTGVNANLQLFRQFSQDFSRNVQGVGSAVGDIASGGISPFPTPGLEAGITQYTPVQTNNLNQFTRDELNTNFGNFGRGV